MRLTPALSLLLTLILLPSARADFTPPTTMPTLQIGNEPLEKVLNQIKAKNPDFHFALFRDPGAPKDYPVLPPMTVEGATVGQFMQLIDREFHNVQITVIPQDQGSPPLYDVDISAPDTHQSAAATTAPASSALGVYAFRLSDIIDYRENLLTGAGDHQKQATNDVLSLIQTALDETDTSSKPTLKIHDATKFLICKLTSEQATLVQAILQAMRPTDDAAKQLFYRQDIAYHRLSAENAKLRDQLAAKNGPATKPSN